MLPPMLDNYLVRILLMFVGSVAGYLLIAGGYYTTFRFLTLVGN